MAMTKKILILAANPKDTTRLRLDEEVREIKEGLRLAKKRELFEIEQREAVRIRDLRRALLDCEPHIVHFSGHGEADGIIVEDEAGNSVLVEPEAVAGLFGLFSNQVECVLLNACFSESQANAINRHIKYVIGMSREIEDQTAIEFTVGFYDAIGAGKTIEQAFKFGCNAIKLPGFPDYLTPVLKINPGMTGEIQSPKSEYQITRTARVFISYKHQADPDEPVAVEVADKLKALGHYVFIDQDMIVGMEWMKRIDEELAKTDFVIPFLSEYSVQSEMVRGEIERAYQLSSERGGLPKILPVRLNYREPFPYPLDKYLNPIHWAVWDSSEDTQQLIDELSQAISGKPLPIGVAEQKSYIAAKPKPDMKAPTYAAQPLKLEMPEGTIDPESKLYIERTTDQVAMDAIERQGVTMTIKAPRQMGKSSLLMRIIQKAHSKTQKIILLDFQLFDKSALQKADTFYYQFCSWLTDELELDNQLDEYWKMNLSNSMKCTRYMQRHLLKQVNGPMLLAMDEVETMFDTDFRSDFFGMLRNWHNSRSGVGSIWKNLDLALVTSTEPYQLIENLNQSPFNVGEVIDLQDFTAEQVVELNKRHGSPFNGQQESQLMYLLHGHPYLVRRAMYLVARGRMTAQELFSNAIDDRGPFGDHLRYHLFRIHDKNDLVQGMLQVINQNNCRDDRIFFRLRGAGLIKREKDKVVPRCELYEQYFKVRLHG